MTRRLPRLLLLSLLLATVLAGGLAVDVGTARPAAAHAALVGTAPADGDRLTGPPSVVTLDFTEGVSLGAGYARVLDSAGERVDIGAAAVTDRTLTVPLRAGLPDDSYVVTYRVVSADAHPVSGAFAFVVGDGALVPAGEAAAGVGDGADPVVAAALPLARWLGFAGLAAGVGVPLALAVCAPGRLGGAGAARARRLGTAGLAAVGVGGLLSLALQGPYSAGTGLGDLLAPQLLSSTLASGHGGVLLVRVLLAVALAAALVPLWRGRSRGWLVPAGVLAALLVLTFAAVGHPVAGSLPGVAVVVTAVHVAAMTAWLGVLVVLLAVLLRPGAGVPPSEDELAGALPRASRLAAWSVVALVLTGVVQSVREVGAPAALVSTTYGWLLVGKLALVVVLLGAAAVSRAWVQQRLGDPVARPGRRVVAHAFAATADGPAEEDGGPAATARRARGVSDLGLLRRSVLVEAAVAAVVLAVSAALVGTPPAAAAAAAPVDVTLPLQSTSAADAGSVQVSLAPASPGPATLHVYLFDAQDRLVQPREIAVTLTEAGQQIGPLDVDLAPAGPGHWVGDDVSLPAAGSWTVTVTVRLDEFIAATASTTAVVR